MKKIILSLAVLLIFGYSYGTNLDEVKCVENIVINEKLIVLSDCTNNIDLVENDTDPSTFCREFGVEIAFAALNDGHSVDEAVELGIAAELTCNALFAISAVINNGGGLD